MIFLKSLNYAYWRATFVATNYNSVLVPGFEMYAFKDAVR